MINVSVSNRETQRSQNFSVVIASIIVRQSLSTNIAQTNGQCLHELMLVL